MIINYKTSNNSSGSKMRSIYLRQNELKHILLPSKAWFDCINMVTSRSQKRHIWLVSQLETSNLFNYEYNLSIKFSSNQFSFSSKPRFDKTFKLIHIIYLVYYYLVNVNNLYTHHWVHTYWTKRHPYINQFFICGLDLDEPIKSRRLSSDQKVTKLNNVFYFITWDEFSHELIPSL